MNLNKIRKKAEASYLGRPGVTGVSVVDGKVRIYVEDYNPIYIPRKINDAEVEVFKTGKVVALALMYPDYQEFTLKGTPWFIPARAVEPMRTTRHRPVPGGVSIGHPSITAGTMGTSLRFLGKTLGISNNHVLAAASSIQNPKAYIGDPIYQPGPYDGGTAEDTVGVLLDYFPFDEGGPNLIDAALWEPSSPDLLSDEILEIGDLRNVKQLSMGEDIQKSGRTTGLMTGQVQDVDATITVGYGAFNLTYEHQIVTDNIAQGGDSGSALVDMDYNMGGLLFAGSDYVTIHNPVRGILDWLGGTYTLPGTSRKPMAAAFIVGALLLA